MKLTIRIGQKVILDDLVARPPVFVATLGRRTKKGEAFFDPKGEGATPEEAKRNLLLALYDAGAIKMTERKPKVKKTAAAPEAPPAA
jgi:hypothetical protein